MLLDLQAPIKIPVLQWLLDDPPPLRGKLNCQIYYDRFFRLFKQLSESNKSTSSVRLWMRDTPSIDLAKTFVDSEYRIDHENRSFLINGKVVYKVDYSAICESNAKAIEYFNLFSTLARGNQHDQHQTTSKTYEANKIVHDIAGKEMISPGHINYTFPLLYLRQSGYSLHEAIHLTIVLSYISLMSGLSPPSIQELGFKEVSNFGTGAAKLYSKLLVDAYNDKFLDLLNLFSLKSDVFPTIIEYLNAITEAVGISSITSSLEIFEIFISASKKSLEKQPYPRNLWYGRILDQVRNYLLQIKTLPCMDGLLLLASPFNFLRHANINPIILSRDGNQISHVMDNSFFNEAATFSVSLNSIKTILFGRERLKLFGQTSDDAAIALEKYLKQFGCSLIH